jgi:hypothetical protein
MRISTVAAALLVLALWSAAPASALDEGVPDLDGHPNVGMLGFDPDGPGLLPANAWCTGMVISDHAFLTAAHCIVAMPPETNWAVTLAGGSPVAPAYRPGRIFDDFPSPFLVPTVRAGQVVVHPDFGGFDNRIHDVAVLLFAPGTFAGVTPVALPRANLLEEVRGLRHRMVRLVGAGGDPEWGNGPPLTFIAEGYRQTAIAPIERLTRTQLLIDGNARATGGSSPCLGDSGSPQFLEDVAVSLHSSNEGENCDATAFEQRLDTRAERRFLSAYADLP